MCGSAKRMCHAGVSAARSQCAYALWCMWRHCYFSRVGISARPSPLAERSSCYTPTLRVDTHPPQEGPTYTRTPLCLCCLSSTDSSRRRRPAKDLGGSTA